MALLSVSDQAAVQSAIDLLEKGTAYETPLADDVIARLAPLVDSPTFASFGVSRGAVYERLRDYPISGLLQFVLTCGETSLTAAQDFAIRAARDLMIIGTAVETPFDAGVVDALMFTAESTGFMTAGRFKAEAEEKPYSTLLRWALHLGTI